MWREAGGTDETFDIDAFDKDPSGKPYIKPEAIQKIRNTQQGMLPTAQAQETTQPQQTPIKKEKKVYTEDEILDTMTPEESQMADRMIAEYLPNSDIYNAINAYRNGIIDKDFKAIEPSYQKAAP